MTRAQLFTLALLWLASAFWVWSWGRASRLRDDDAAELHRRWKENPRGYRL